jgi:non-ribosomal peptide synthetase component F
MVMLAGFNVLMKHYSGEEEIVVGTDVANRTRRETEGLIGFFVNQLVMKTWVGGEADFREMVRRVREVALEAYANQEVPFEKVVEAINPQREMGRTPLFQVKLVLQNVPHQSLIMRDLEIRLLEIESQSAKHDLMVWLRESPEGLVCFFDYLVGLFDDATILQMTEHFKNILQEAANQPEIKVSRLLHMLTESELQQSLARGQESKDSRRTKLKEFMLKHKKALS